MQRASFVPISKQPSQTKPKAKDHLPPQPTPFIGRERETAAACQLLQHPDTRLLTITGPGGVGKTRLALAVAANLGDSFADGIFFIPLEALRDPNLVIFALAQTLRIGEAGEQPLLERLHDYLADKQMLLVLDNFEQVLAAAPLVSELLAACLRLKILLTSRAVLRLHIEHEFPVSPLALPDLSHLADLEELSKYGAVALFVQCAQAVQPDFQLTSTLAPVVAEICTRLDGLPLAIELAAARIKLLPPQAMLARMVGTDGRTSLHLLKGRAIDIPERQQTLRRTLDWSYELLLPDEQRLFRCLSVFAGGCTLEAAEAVCHSPEGGNTLSVEALDGLEALLDKSLLRRVEQAMPGENTSGEAPTGGPPRFGMLETVREYALEQLTESLEEEVLRRAHLLYYVELAEKAASQFNNGGRSPWMHFLEAEHDNLRAALHWAVEHMGREGMELALRLSGALWWFWLARGYLSEGRLWLEKALNGSRHVEASVRAKALNGAGVLAHYQGDYGQAVLLCGESLKLFRELGDPSGIAAALGGLAMVARVGGNYAAACAMYEEILTICRALGDQRSIANALSNLGLTLWLKGDYQAARPHLEEGLFFFRRLKSRQGTAFSLQGLAWVALSLGEYGAARPQFEEARKIARELGDRRSEARSIFGLGYALLGERSFMEARSQLEEALKLHYEFGDKWYITGCLTGLADVAVASRQPELAIRLLGAATALLETIGASQSAYTQALYAQVLATARAQVTEATFAAAWAQGQRMEPEQFIPLEEQASRETADRAASLSSAGEHSAAPSPSSHLKTQAVDSPPERRRSPIRAYASARLSAREEEVLHWVAAGLTNAEIAEQLVLSPPTVNAHLRSIYSKLGVTSRSAAIRYALDHHLG